MTDRPKTLKGELIANVDNASARLAKLRVLVDDLPDIVPRKKRQLIQYQKQLKRIDSMFTDVYYSIQHFGSGSNSAFRKRLLVRAQACDALLSVLEEEITV